jgi:hypothetical protein
MQAVLTEHLAKYRAWPYSVLAERVEVDLKQHECLEHVEGQADDGTLYYLEFQAVWDDKAGGDVRVLGSLSAEPQKPLFGFLPIYCPDVTDSFIMAADGHFVGEG